MNLRHLLSNDMIWNKEKIQVVIIREQEENIVSEITRIEFLYDDYEQEIDYFESAMENGESFIRFYLEEVFNEKTCL